MNSTIPPVQLIDFPEEILFSLLSMIEIRDIPAVSSVCTLFQSKLQNLSLLVNIIKKDRKYEHISNLLYLSIQNKGETTRLSVEVLNCKYQKINNIALLTKFLPNLKEVKFENCLVLPETNLEPFANLKNIQKLHLTALRGDDILDKQSLTAIAKRCPKLQELSIEYSHLQTGGCLATIQNFTQLQFLSLHHGIYGRNSTSELALNDDHLIAIFQACKELRVLKLFVDTLTDKSLVNIAKLSKLKELSLNSCRLSNLCLETILNALKDLQKLEMSWRSKKVVGISLLAPIPEISNLQELVLKETNVDDQSFNVILQSCKKLRTLEIDETYSKTLTSVSLAAIGELTYLENLYMSNNNIDDQNLLKITQSCKNLQKFSLIKCKNLSGLHLSTIANFQKLHSLVFDDISLNDQILQSILQSCKSLTSLTIINCKKLTGIGISKIAEKPFSQLSELKINSIDIDDKTFLEIMRSHSKIQILGLTSCDQLTNISLVAITKLKNLHNLSLTKIHIDDHNLSKILQSCEKLESIALTKCKQLTDLSLAKISNLSNLLRLWLYKLKISPESILTIQNGCNKLIECNIIEKRST